MNARFTCEDVAHAALGEPVKREGTEILYRCPRPERHTNGDVHPSLKVNTKKDVWACFVCGASGTAWVLAAFIARVEPNDKHAVRAWLQGRGLVNGKREQVDAGGPKKPKRRLSQPTITSMRKGRCFTARTAGSRKASASADLTATVGGSRISRASAACFTGSLK